jgi:phosphoribosylanthranilate isomerase
MSLSQSSGLVMTVKVKVCGITNLADAVKSLEFGADMLGFNFYAPSPRAIAPEKAREIIAGLPAESFNVALFVNESSAKVRAVLADGPQAYRGLQFHGEESEDRDRRLPRGFLFARLMVARLRRLGSGVPVAVA